MCGISTHKGIVAASLFSDFLFSNDLSYRSETIVLTFRWRFTST